MNTLVDLIFRGNYSIIDFNFIEELVSQSKEISFNFPENIVAETFNEIIEIIKDNSYVDLIISIDIMNLEKIDIPHVFVNFGRDNEDIELLFFFDVKDINDDFQKGLDYLYHWSVFLKKQNRFESFFCQTDGINYKNDYLFQGD